MPTILHSKYSHSLLICAIAASLFCSQSQAKQNSHNFVGRDNSDASFISFRTTMLEFIKNHDKDGIETCLSENIGTTIGGESGISAFEKLWQNLDDTSAFWVMCKKALDHGAQVDGETSELHAPAVSFEDDHSNYPQGIVWSKDAMLFNSPAETSASKKAPYNGQLTILEPKQRKPLSARWLKVRTRLGVVGYMKADDVSSSFDNFAVFKKENGKWKMTWFGYAEL